MMLEWNCSRFIRMVPNDAVPTPPPKLLSILVSPEAATVRKPLMHQILSRKCVKVIYGTYTRNP